MPPSDHDRSIPWIARVLLDTGPSGVALLEGPDFTYAYVNRSYQDLAPERPMLGRSVEEVWPEVASRLVSLMQQVRETGQALEASDMRLDLVRNGRLEPLWFSFTFHAIAGRPGEPAAIAAHAVDRTAAVLARLQEAELRAGRERAEEAARAAEAAHLLAEAIPHVVWTTDARGHADWYNARWYEYTGASQEESRGLGWQAVVHPDDAQRTAARWAMSVASGEPFEVEVRLRGADGQYRWHLGRGVPARAGDGSVLRWFATCTDIDDQKRAQEEIQRSRTRAEESAHAAALHAAELDAVLDSIADGLVLVDARGQLVRTNAAADRMFRFTPADRRVPAMERLARFRAFGKNLEPVPPDRLPTMLALRGEELRGVELRFDWPDAPPTWLSTSAAPIRGLDGELHGAVATFSDITSIHALQDQREDLLRAISHDLRTPLTVVMAQAQMLARRPEDVPTVVRRAETIRTSAARMATMIGDLVDVVRLEAGQVAVEPRPVALAPFAAELRERLRGALAVDRLRLEVPEALPPALADPPRLERILVNLVSNALKYSPPDTEAVLSAERQGGGIRITVRDRGPGIPPEEVPRIFERFWRSPSVQTQKEGLGLGLYITRLLVEAHRGDIDVESEVGKGSAFHVRLPVAT
ncbi:MAG TPA: ATP-binding protein [Anaeromyxobacteraceae bacterium]|nr:ATP-binding protein [Anaeromyxobacteraceae bacterium]